MRNKMKYLLFLPLVTLISCGYSVSNLVYGDKYVSSIFNENYYTHWDNELKGASIKATYDVTDKKIESLSDLGNIDRNFFDGHVPSTDEYGDEYRMNAVDESFNYGYQSKLFDGQMVCGAQNGREEYAYQKGRVQINEDGFSVRFSKESNDLHYFALQFKASTDDTVDCYPVNSEEKSYYGSTPEEHSIHDNKLFHHSDFTLNITLYVKNGASIEGHLFKSTINFEKTNDGHQYKFFAFDLEAYELSRLVGASVTITDLHDDLIEWNKNRADVNDITYALFLYEMFFPYTNWN